MIIIIDISEFSEIWNSWCDRLIDRSPPQSFFFQRNDGFSHGFFHISFPSKAGETQQKIWVPWLPLASERRSKEHKAPPRRSKSYPEKMDLWFLTVVLTVGFLADMKWLFARNLHLIIYNSFKRTSPFWSKWWFLATVSEVLRFAKNSSLESGESPESEVNDVDSWEWTLGIGIHSQLVKP